MTPDIRWRKNEDAEGPDGVAGLLVDAAHDQHPLDTRLPSAGHDRVAVGIKLRQVDVAVGVDERHARTGGVVTAPGANLQDARGIER